MSEIAHTEYRILLIEDNPGDAFLTKFYLDESNTETSSFSVVHVEELNAGFQKLSEAEFDIVLLDLNLPDSRDLQTVISFLEKFPDQLVIAMTGLTDEKVGVEAVKLGAQDFLTKGRFEAKVLSSSIKYAFERFQLNKQVKSFKQEFKLNRWRMNFLEKALTSRYAEFYKDGQASSISETLMASWNIEKISDLTLQDFIDKFQEADELTGTLDSLEVDGNHKLISLSDKESGQKYQGGVDIANCPVQNEEKYRFLIQPI